MEKKLLLLPLLSEPEMSPSAALLSSLTAMMPAKANRSALKQPEAILWGVLRSGTKAPAKTTTTTAKAKVATMESMIRVTKGMAP